MDRTTDLYECLGLTPFVSQETIARAYRGLARKYHPDIDKSPGAEERMKEINRAYAVLGDPEQRRNYDRDRKILKQQPIPRESGEDRGGQRPVYAPASRQTPAPAPAPSPSRHHRVAVAAGLLVLLLVVGLLAVTGTPKTAPAGEPAAAGPGLSAATGAYVVKPISVTTTLPLIVAAAPVPKTFGELKEEGDAYLLRHRNGDALAAYKQALVIRPNASEVWIAEGYTYEIMGDFYLAVVCYDRALAMSPGAGEWVGIKSRVLANQSGLMERADRLVEDGDYPAAIAIYDEILAAGIQNTGFKKRVLSAKVYALMRSGDADGADLLSREIQSL